MGIEKSEARREEPRNMEEPIAAKVWELPVGNQSAAELIGRGKQVEHDRGMYSHDNLKLAEALSHMAHFGNHSSSTTSLLMVAAGRLAEMNTDRDLWRKHVPVDTEVNSWELLIYKNLGGSVARFTIARRLPSGPHFEAIIMIVASSGDLIELNRVDAQCADEFVDQARRFQNYHGRMR